jgi:hypothetical protein
MGLDPGFCNVVFVRKFRWTLSGPHLPEQWLKKVEFDWMNKRLYCEVYETFVQPGKVAVIDWLESFEEYANEPLVFTTWDGCGNAIYEYTLHDLTLWKNDSDFDYSSSDVSTRKIVVSFSDAKYRAFDYIDHKVEPEASLNGEIDTDPVPIHTLNDRTWLRGRVVKGITKWIPFLNPHTCRSPKNTSQEQ